MNIWQFAQFAILNNAGFGLFIVTVAAIRGLVILGSEFAAALGRFGKTGR